jgi:small conductance mechanosensitive channel
MLEKIRAFFAEGNWVDAIVPFLTNLLIAIAIYVIGRWLAFNLIKLIDKAMSLRKMDQALRGFIVAILRTLVTFMIGLIALEQMGINTTSLLALLGAAGLAVGLALKDSLSNFAAGVMLILFKPFKIGDFVEAGSVAGIVERIEVFNTLFCTADNKAIIVPNAQIYGGTIINYNAKPTRRIDLEVGVSYSDNLGQVQQLLRQILAAEPRVLQEPPAVVAVHELGESSVNLVVRPWCATADYWELRWSLVQAIKETFDANGITIPFPQRTLLIQQANALAAGPNAPSAEPQ